MKARSALVYSVLRLLAFLVPFGIMMLFPIFQQLYWLAAIFSARASAEAACAACSGVAAAAAGGSCAAASGACGAAAIFGFGALNRPPMRFTSRFGGFSATKRRGPGPLVEEPDPYQRVGAGTEQRAQFAR